MSEKRCGTCAVFKRTFPKSRRLRQLGTCYWLPPKGLVFPDSMQSMQMQDDWGTKCKCWQAISAASTGRNDGKA